ncbi:protein sel-1 homolog 3 [Archocentrus centrarchus]|uniref:protein sel-1 homolog 3 n=1 Tax=Archocentrus centrarchus TaxID=63155 RepID=UPI0011E9E49E|nr:protein sel-1 homolog 3-like [Archocentrus centrarchus]
MDIHTVYKYICRFCLTVQVIWGLDEVKILNPPEEALPDHLLEVLYSCDEPATVQLDCVVSFETGTISTLLLRRWACVPGDTKIRAVKLNLPDWLVYRADGIVPDSHWVLSCILRASVRHSGYGDTVRAQHVAALEPKPYLSRRVKQHQLCIAWGTQMLQLTKQFFQKQCALEQETVHLLSSIYASTGERFGITKTLDPHRSEVLEYSRIRAISFPWCTFSIWLYVTGYCQEALCGIFHHIDSQNNYVTPALLLTNSGHLHIQMNGESVESSAFLSAFKVPLNEWCNLIVMLQGRTVTVGMVCLDKDQRTVISSDYMFRFTIILDDTEGYFVIGGGKYIRGVEGYFGPVVYHRNRILPGIMSDFYVPDIIQNSNLAGWLQTCHEFHLEMNTKISGHSLKVKQRTESGTCSHAFHKWMVKQRLPSNRQCEPWEAAAPHRRHAAKLAQLLVLKHGGRPVSLHALGRALYSLSLHKLGKASSAEEVSRALSLLLQAGCLADTRALHMSSVLYSAGLGTQKKPIKAWLLGLLGAQRDDRLALLHLGHLHQQGLQGQPVDPDLAYAYYANIAHQTTLDRHNPSPQQTTVEPIFLNNDEMLNIQTNENHHIFQWLKHQARKGVTEAEQAIARMLFWGQQGVTPNIQEAVRHYERGAVQWEDPVSMYDYGIVLLQGHGVKKDVSKGITFLKKAMDKGHVPAMNALAWYYEQFEKDYKQAVQLWEQADLLMCPEAALNLGVIYSQGLYPGKAANQYMAYKYYLKSAERGNIRGGILIADIWTTGMPGFVNRHPSDAVLWVKWAAEHNGYLGSILRKALDAYLKNDMFMSLLYYLMAAESGYAAAQFNVAYLCEQNSGGFLDPVYASDCMWRYYNLTIQSQNPNTYAFIRMGDLFYERRGNRQKNLFSAVQMYTQAALRSNPQGWYNLGLLAEEGYKLPLSTLTALGLSELYLADKDLLLVALYKRCRDSEDTDSFFPCSLALFNVYVHQTQMHYKAAIKFCTAVAVVAAPTVLLIVLGTFRRRFLSLH